MYQHKRSVSQHYTLGKPTAILSCRTYPRSRVRLSSPVTSEHRGVPFGRARVDALTYREAMAAVYQLEAGGMGGSTSTPNVDHVVHAETSSEFGGAYDLASLSLGIVWRSARDELRVHASAALKV